MWKIVVRFEQYKKRAKTIASYMLFDLLTWDLKYFLRTALFFVVFFDNNISPIWRHYFKNLFKEIIFHPFRQPTLIYSIHIKILMAGFSSYSSVWWYRLRSWNITSIILVIFDIKRYLLIYLGNIFFCLGRIFLISRQNRFFSNASRLLYCP